jgi:hypothetical protein
VTPPGPVELIPSGSEAAPLQWERSVTSGGQRKMSSNPMPQRGVKRISCHRGNGCRIVAEWQYNK